MIELDISTNPDHWEQRLQELPGDDQYRFLETLGAAYQMQIGVVFKQQGHQRQERAPQRLDATDPTLNK